MDEKVKQSLTLTDRKYLKIEGVQHVGSFDEKEIMLDTVMGFLSLKGEGLHITQLNLGQGLLVVEGFISSMSFQENKTARGGKGKGMINRIFK